SEVLRLVARGEMVPHAEKEIVVGRLHDAAAEMIAAGERPVLVENHRDVFEPGPAFAHQPGACKRRASAGESLPPLETMRRLPGRSVTSIRPSGRNASAQG